VFGGSGGGEGGAMEVVDDGGMTVPLMDSGARDAATVPDDDSGSDASDSEDAGHDAAPWLDADIADGCECSVGPCCDGCMFESGSHVCEVLIIDGECRSNGSFVARAVQTSCSSNSPACNGRVDTSPVGSMGSPCSEIGSTCSWDEGREPYSWTFGEAYFHCE